MWIPDFGLTGSFGPGEPFADFPRSCSAFAERYNRERRPAIAYRGRVRDGVVVLDGDAKMPEGTELRVEPMKERPLIDLVDVAEGVPHDPEWPADGAAGHDHYLYGTAKRDQ